MLGIIHSLILASAFSAYADVRCPSNVEFAQYAQVTDQGVQKDLELNGVGLKKYIFFNVFYGALYLENLNNKGEDVVASDEAKIITVHALMGISKDQLVDEWDREFERLCEDQCDELRPFHEQFVSNARDVAKHERLHMIFKSDRLEYEDDSGNTYEPIMSPAYGKIMLRSSVGEEAADGKLRDGMLGQDKKLCKQI